MSMPNKIGLGGGCHWCTEGVFASLKGIVKIEQGWVSAVDEPARFSEAIIVHYQSEIIELKDLLEIHLHTHASTSFHSMRQKYRSAIYTFSEEQYLEVKRILPELQLAMEGKLVTEILNFNTFKSNIESLQDYLYTRPNAPFCQRYILPKLNLIRNDYGKHINTEKVKSAGLILEK